MSRPRKQTVDYFPHCTIHKKTIYILEQQFGNDGYAFWFKLLEVLGSTDGHVYDTKDSKNWFYLVSRAGVDGDKGAEILNLLASLDAIDNKLWEKGIIWCQNFVDNLAPLYKKRLEDIPSRPVSGVRNQVSAIRKPQRIGKDRKGKDSKKTFMSEKFDLFWKKYPKKIGKQNALKAWEKNNLDNGDFETIMKGLDGALVSEQWHQSDGQYIPHPTTWINQKRWEDEYEVKIQPTTKWVKANDN